MKCFKLTSPHIKGCIEVIYDFDAKLYEMKFGSATILPGQIHQYKQRIPVLSENIYQAFEGTEVKVTEKDFSVTFEDFKREYPYKRNMHLAEKHWPKLTSGQQFSAFLAAIQYRKYLEGLTWNQNPMLPEKFLKTEQWKNDYSTLNK